ncbi:MAG: DNA gyrase inhibitor YacG [Acidobacteria bacterium]|nr:DNA gyrase inhibitor YacG [Acidobacteriota bacterium]
MTEICPTCRKESAPVGNTSRPFCSDRCRMIDLGRWMSEEYRVALPGALDDRSEIDIGGGFEREEGTGELESR